jgi:rifampicin phosphotransferase
MDVVDLRDIEEDMYLVGGKALGLGRMIRLGVRVPDGFCVTTRIHSLGEIPKDAVLDAYHRLGRGRVAVRSSATAEDLADASFAGQLDTFLNVEGDEELLAAIEKCWASLDGARAVAYRDAHRTNEDAVAMAVVVQRMVDPQAAGVMFTANPITGTRSEIVIDAVSGSEPAWSTGRCQPTTSCWSVMSRRRRTDACRPMTWSDCDRPGVT